MPAWRLISISPIARTSTLVHHREDANAARSGAVYDAEGKASAKVPSVRIFERGGDLGVLANDLPDSMNLVEEVPTKTGCAVLVEGHRLRELG
jgi:hypothetical protein